MSWGKDFLKGVNAAMRPAEPRIVLLKGQRLEQYQQGFDSFTRVHHAASHRVAALELTDGPAMAACIGIFGEKAGRLVGTIAEAILPS